MGPCSDDATPLPFTASAASHSARHAPRWSEADTAPPAPLDMASASLNHDRIDHYLIHRRAGEGGMGIVFEATDTRDDSRVAVKVLRGGLIDAEAMDRFEREHNMLARLEHPKIVRYLDHGHHCGDAYLVTEWLAGHDLHSELECGRLSVPDACKVVRDIAEALGHTHQLGMVHRDVKPQNIFLSAGRLDDARLLDFGIARLVHSEERLTGTGAIIGTPGYMSPEQIRAKDEINARADIFALGCVLFECLTGTRCFAGAHAVAVVASVLHEEVSLQGRLPSNTPRALKELLGAMLSKDPWGRPANGAAVVAALQRISSEGAPATDLATPAIRASREHFVSMILVSSGSGHPRTAAAVLETELASLGARHVPVSSKVSLVEMRTLAHGDQPVRAAHCALRLAAALPDSALMVVSGRANVAGGQWVGEMIDNGVRTLGGAASGIVIVDALTASMLSDRFELTQAAGLQLLVRSHTMASVRRELLGRPTPCLGRTKELGLLESTWRETRDESVNNAVLVVGPPGIGKSRLRYEFLSNISKANATVLLARDQPLTMGARHGTIGRLLRHACGIGEGDDDALAAGKLVARIRQTLPQTRPADRLPRSLAELAGITLQNAPPAVVDATTLRDDWLTWLRAECTQLPVVLVIEDIHWSDARSVALLDETLTELDEQSLMIVALARPEIEKRHRGLWSARRIQRIDLAPLRQRVCIQLAREVLGDRYEEEALQRLAQRSGGNAFFLEELIRAAADGNITEVPDSVHGLLQARLEKLGELQRRVLQAASIVGPQFWRGAIASLLRLPAGDARLAQAIAILAAAELVHEEPVSSIPGETELRFRHALVRESVHATIEPRQRRSAHLAAAKWKESCGINDPRLLVNHYVAQGDADTAASWLERLCSNTWYTRACPGFDNIVERIVGMLDDIGDQHQLARAHLSVAIGWNCLSRFDNGYAALNRAQQLGVDAAVAARVEIRMAARQFDLLRAAKAIEQWRSLANADDADWELLYSMASTFTNLGRIEEARAALAEYDRCAPDIARAKLQALKIRAFIAITERDFKGSVQPYLHLVELARKQGLAIERGNALHNVSESLARSGEFKAARQAVEASDQIAVALGYERLVAMNAALRLWLRFMSEDADVEDQLRQCVARAEQHGWRWDAVHARRLLCNLLMAQGDREESRAIAQELLDVAKQYHFRLFIDDARELLHALA